MLLLFVEMEFLKALKTVMTELMMEFMDAIQDVKQAP